MVCLSWVSLNILIEKNGQVGLNLGQARRDVRVGLGGVDFFFFFFFFEAIRWCGFVLTVCMKMSFLFFYLIQLKNNIRSTKHIFYGQQRTSPMINFLCFGVKCKMILLSFGRLEFEKLFVKPKSSPVDQEKHYLLQKIFYAL